RAVRSPDPRRIGGDLVDRLAARGTLHLLAHQRIVAAGPRGGIVLLDQQPVLAVVAGARAGHAHERPAAAQLLALELELELALAPRLERLALLGAPGAAVPEQHGAAAVFPGRDDALEGAGIDRVVLDLPRQPLLVRIQARPFRHRPALQHAVHLQAEVIVQAARGMLLHHEGGPGGRCRRAAPGPLAARRLRRAREVPLPPILLERHGLRRSAWRCGGGAAPWPGGGPAAGAALPRRRCASAAP